MTDLHCHILPGIDDGAKDVETSIALLQMEKEQGVNNIIFTPHFRCDEMSLSEFLQRREEAYRTLLAALPKELAAKFHFKLGAEVYFSPNLQNVPLAPLCFEGTSYLLVELPFTQKPTFLTETLFDICTTGITPIIAHVERYEYLDDLTQFYDWVEAGLCIQTNAKTVASGDKLIRKMIDWQLIQLMGSDAHSLHRRPVDIGKGYESLSETARAFILKNGDDIFENYELENINPHYPKKFLGSWK